jgi:hypothetical protein
METIIKIEGLKSLSKNKKPSEVEKREGEITLQINNFDIDQIGVKGISRKCRCHC